MTAGSQEPVSWAASAAGAASTTLGPAAATVGEAVVADGVGETLFEAVGLVVADGEGVGVGGGVRSAGGAFSGAGPVSTPGGSGTAVRVSWGTGLSPPAGLVFLARSWSGVTVGRPWVPSMLVPPKIHRSTLPGFGL